MISSTGRSTTQNGRRACRFGGRRQGWGIVVLAGLFMVTRGACGSPQERSVVELLDDGALLRVPVTLFGETKFFVVDTGAVVTCLDTRYKARLGAPVRNARLHTGVGAQVRAEVYAAPPLALGGKSVELDNVACADLSLQRMIVGGDCDGILGIDALKAHVMVLDFRRHEMSLEPPGIRHNAGSALVRNDEGRYLVQAAVNGAGSEKLMVDTGTNSVISLNASAWERRLSTDDRAKAVHVLLSSIGGQITASQTARLRSVQIGEAVRQDPICALLAPGKRSSVGFAFFRGLRAVFDFPGETLELTPAAASDAREEADMSGLHLLKISGIVTVYGVDAASPAATAGIQPGDTVLDVDGKAPATMKDLRAEFMTAPGETRLVRLLRQGSLVSTRVILRRAL